MLIRKLKNKYSNDKLNTLRRTLKNNYCRKFGNSFPVVHMRCLVAAHDRVIILCRYSNSTRSLARGVNYVSEQNKKEEK